MRLPEPQSAWPPGSTRTGAASTAFGRDGLRLRRSGYRDPGGVSPAIRSHACGGLTGSQRALINRLGFNNEGPGGVHRQRAPQPQRSVKRGGVLGLNIGKNAATPIERALDDYLTCVSMACIEHADYVTVNISSPNTKNLRDLAIATKPSTHCSRRSRRRARSRELGARHGRRVPIFVKIAPDLDRGTGAASLRGTLTRHRHRRVSSPPTPRSARDAVQATCRMARKPAACRVRPSSRRATAVISPTARGPWPRRTRSSGSAA